MPPEIKATTLIRGVQSARSPRPVLSCLKRFDENATRQPVSIQAVPPKAAGDPTHGYAVGAQHFPLAVV